MSESSFMSKVQSSRGLSDGGKIGVVVVSGSTSSLFFITIAIQNEGL